MIGQQLRRKMRETTAQNKKPVNEVNTSRRKIQWAHDTVQIDILL